MEIYFWGEGLGGWSGETRLIMKTYLFHQNQVTNYQMATLYRLSGTMDKFTKSERKEITIGRFTGRNVYTIDKGEFLNSLAAGNYHTLPLKKVGRVFFFIRGIGGVMVFLF